MAPKAVEAKGKGKSGKRAKCFFFCFLAFCFFCWLSCFVFGVAWLFWVAFFFCIA